MKEYRLKNFWKTTENLFGKDFSQLVEGYLLDGEQAAHSDILSDSQADKIEQFFGLIGRGDAEAQREAVSAYGEYFRNELKNAENREQKQGKSEQEAWIFAGCIFERTCIVRRVWKLKSYLRLLR